MLDVPAADPSFLADAALGLATGFASLGITVSEGALVAMRGLGDDFETTVDVLTPTDACPDNNVLSGDGTMTMLDFEGAEVRHAALDAARRRGLTTGTCPVCRPAGRAYQAPAGLVSHTPAKGHLWRGRRTVRGRVRT